jgi:hypothetical protein
MDIFVLVGEVVKATYKEFDYPGEISSKMLMAFFPTPELIRYDSVMQISKTRPHSKWIHLSSDQEERPCINLLIFLLIQKHGESKLIKNYRDQHN